jgi:hypothetical protein
VSNYRPDPQPSTTARHQSATSRLNNEMQHFHPMLWISVVRCSLLSMLGAIFLPYLLRSDGARLCVMETYSTISGSPSSHRLLMYWTSRTPVVLAHHIGSSPAGIAGGCFSRRHSEQ